jgi:DNA-binding response OmpR family regulator
VIDGDEWFGKVLGDDLRERGFLADVCTEARAGFRKACEAPWDCIVCSPQLPDIDGLWVARRVRTEAGTISKTPILFVGELNDGTERTQALSVGVDVFLGRPPASLDDIAAQVGALIAMVKRYDSDEAPPSATMQAAAIRGDLSAFPLASMLMMLEMERRSGTMQVVAQSNRRAVLTISHGLFASTEIGGQQRPAIEVLREVLSWRAGRFSFASGESGTLPEPRASVGAVVLEAMRLEDEEKGPLPELDSEELVDRESSVNMQAPNMRPPEDKVQVRSGIDHQKPPPVPRPPKPPALR